MIKLFSFTPDFEQYHEIQYQSLQAEEHYNEIGKITVIAEATDYNIEHLKKGNFLYWTESEQAFWIRRISPSTADNTLTVNGYTTNALLNKRVCVEPGSFDGIIAFTTADGLGYETADGEQYVFEGVENAAEGVIYDMVLKNLRGLERIEIANMKNLPEKYSAAFEHRQMLDETIKALELTPYGNKMIFDHRNKKHIFDIFEGRDITEGSKAVRFSEEFGTAKNLVIDLDDSLFKNVCYVTGKKNDEEKTPVTVTVGDAEGDDRFEFWISQEFSQEKEETDEAFTERLLAEGRKALAERAAVQNFSVEIDSSEYGKVYKLGDMVTCVSRRFGVKFNSRITGVKFTQDPEIKNTSLVLGNPTISIFKEMKLWR